ncbi:TetR family transcriptional regulator [Streptomyces chrestomyceticus JCM 4735]|uniref:TetR family transcriptional regulator n=1 Tax=Streptomyces chrestomyceticus JCM 4735 TaxID=1306181 RepID=A0A7U9Q021_9ACTN|nr:TetR/AcrR family transcriptional regulator [Streptomyces chrestomyceticus]GCD34884.1 TetR family transcriptional regulator [Streptomyces chrestomyceticus JCM 4735]
MEADERAERGERVLDAACELLLAWGYRRVTADEIARRADVGKGTVYLHWKNKDALLLAVVLRAKAADHRRQLDRMRADHRCILPSRALRGSLLDFMDDPVLRALYLDDSDILGRLNDIAKKELVELVEASHETLRSQLTTLRAHGLVREDLSVDQQMYVCMATVTGYVQAEVLLPDRAPGAPEERADLLCHTVRTALEPPGDPDPEAVAAAAPAVITRYARLEELSRQEVRRQLRP